MAGEELIKMVGKWALHPIYQTKYADWVALEQAISKLATTTEKGDAFEQFCYFYFLFHKDLYDIAEVWADKVRGREIPSSIRTQYHFEKRDYGVDGVNQLTSGKLEAWQAKFHTDRSSASYSELATFLTEAQSADFHRIIANCSTLPRVITPEKFKGHRQTLVDRFLDLSSDFFEALYAFAMEEREPAARQRHTPRPHQETMIERVLAGLRTNDRGKLIAACGTGKTLSRSVV